MLKSLWAGRWYMLLGLLSFLVLLVVNTPIHFAWKHIEPILGRTPVQIDHPVGSLWQGQAEISFDRIKGLTVNWQLSPLALVTGQADVQFTVSHDELGLEGQAKVSGLYSGKPSVLSLSDVQGYLNSQLLAPYLRAERISLQGDFELSDLDLSIHLIDKSFQQLSGRLVFAGGDASVPGQRRQEELTLPMMIADFGLVEDKVVVPVVTEDAEPLGQLYLQSDGWGGVSILKRSFDVVGQIWPDKQADADTVVFEVSQKVL